MKNCQSLSFAKSSHRLGGIGSVFLLLICAFPAAAEDWQVHGFFGQSLITSSDNNFFGETKNHVSSEYTEAGLNTSLRTNPELLFSAQILFRRAGRSEDTHTRLDYGFLRYTPLADENRSLSVQVGKQKFPYGFYNETRDTPTTRPSILLPESIYFDSLRNTFQSAPGIQLFDEHALADGTLNFRLGAFRSNSIDKNGKLFLFAADTPGDYKDGRMNDWQLAYESSQGDIRAALGRMRYYTRYRSGPLDLISDHELGYDGTVASWQWNSERWSLTTEFSRVTESINSDDPLLAFRMTGSGYYLQGEWRFSPQWQVFARYDNFYADRNDKNGKLFAAQTGRPSSWIFASDRTIGARYRFSPGWSLAGEWHNINGNGWLPHADNMVGNVARYDLTQRWNLFLMQIAYQF